MTKEELIINYSPRDNEMNHCLVELYQSIPSEFSEYINEYNAKLSPKITNPFLLAASNTYFNADKRIMVVGQETFGWYSEGKTCKDYPDLYSTSNSILELQALYNWFVNYNKGYSSPIWDLYRKIYDKAKQYGIGVMSNNIAKIGYVSGNTGFDHKACSYLQPVFRKELSICKPNLLLFFTGPEYDSIIEETIGRFKYIDVIGLGTRKYAKLNFMDYPQIEAYRTYHPGYLRRNDKTDWVKSAKDKLYRAIDDLHLLQL